MEKFEASLLDVLKVVVSNCLETDVEVITKELRKVVPSLDTNIKEMGLDSFEGAVYYAMWQVAEAKCEELAKRVEKRRDDFVRRCASFLPDWLS